MLTIAFWISARANGIRDGLQAPVKSDGERTVRGVEALHLWERGRVGDVGAGETGRDEVVRCHGRVSHGVLTRKKPASKPRNPASL